MMPVNATGTTLNRRPSIRRSTRPATDVQSGRARRLAHGILPRPGITPRNPGPARHRFPSLGTIVAAVEAFLAALYRTCAREPLGTTPAQPARLPRSLPRGGVLQVTNHHRTAEVRVRHGLLWITATPSRGDVLLGPGDRFRFGPDRPYVLEALEPAQLQWMP